MVVEACYVWLPWMYAMHEYSFFLSYEICISSLVINLTNSLLSRMAPETGAHAGNEPPPPPEPDMMQVLRLLLEEREAARTERQANLATL
jgi:hypothetical protein